MGLREYQRKRDFSRTREPRGKRRSSRGALKFVVQKHDASHLHYDFRLEMDGVLKSWAVPKGPDLNPANKRLAMQVEDHPLEYAQFEGIIPAGEYGGGTVMLWDEGTWEPLGDARKDYREGRLKFVLHGQKLRGAWMLVRRGGKSAAANERHWFLFKERDEYARTQGSITESQPLSVTTGRNLNEISAEADRVRGPDGEHAKRRTPKKDVGRRTAPAVKRTAAARKNASAAIAISAARSSSGKANVAGIALSHPDKILYPDVGLTKLDLAEYYAKIADWMLPHVVGRPLALLRCPGGQAQHSFFQKHPGAGKSKHLAEVDVSESRKPELNLAIKDVAGLIELVQMNVLEIHVWGSIARRLQKPDRLVFDLDPDASVPWPRVVIAAREVRLVLEELGLRSFLKTTGGKGLHVVVPIQPGIEWDEAKRFSKEVADLIVRAAPDRYIATMNKAARKGKIFLDYLRNGRGATAIAPYSTRARPGAPVSVPISWEELSPQMRPDQFTVASVPARLARLKRDPWKDLASTKQSITRSMFAKLSI